MRKSGEKKKHIYICMLNVNREVLNLFLKLFEENTKRCDISKTFRKFDFTTEFCSHCRYNKIMCTE